MATLVDSPTQSLAARIRHAVGTALLWLGSLSFLGFIAMILIPAC